MKNKNNKKKNIALVVSSVLNPLRYNKFKDKKQAFHHFLHESTDHDFNKAIGILIKDTGIFSYLYQSKMPNNHFITKEILTYNTIDLNRLVTLFEKILVMEKSKLFEMKKLKINAESFFIKGDFEQVISFLDKINFLNGISIWELNFRISILTEKNEANKIGELVETCKAKELEPIQNQIINLSEWRSHGADVKLIIENMVRKDVKEYIEGGALDLAAYVAVNCLQYPLYDDVNFIHSIYYLQLLPLIDLYEALSKITTYLLINGKPIKNEGEKIIKLIESLNINSFQETIKLKKDAPIENITPVNDREIIEYSQGKYSEIIFRLENNINEIDNIISKLNIIAKSYIYSRKKPTQLPLLLNKIIENLIAIYSLVESNQAISQLLDIAITYSFLEISDHILISIVIAAPYYFDDRMKKKIIDKSNFFEIPLTPLAFRLQNSSTEYSNLPRIDECRNAKYEAIVAIENHELYALDLINEYEKNTCIPKESIELKVKYYLKNNDNEKLVKYCTDELIKNPYSNICLPLREVISYITDNNLYSLDSLICAYYHYKYSESGERKILNEFFEEYIISKKVNRPSELIHNSMNQKEIFFLTEISKVDMMDFLGCFTDENDLKIERIKILNDLVVFGYLTQSDIDSEYKIIVDSIFIDSEAAKFNHAKIFVDTDYIYKKIKNDVDGLVLKYHSADSNNTKDFNLQYGIEDGTILKGDKNIIVTKIFTLFLQEFIKNKEVGLDINLSSEIRHGFFSNLLCSSLQRKHLITELDDNSFYKENSYWLNYYNMINVNILNDLNKVFMKFSESFNLLIEEAENWMKTSLRHTDGEGVFIFDITIEDFDELKELLDNNKASSEIAKLIFKKFNDKLLFCLNKIKEKLNVEFVSKLDELFIWLVESINQVKGSTSMSDLLEAINLSKTEIKENIHTVTEWFTPKKKRELETIELKKLIYIAIKCFKQINNCEISISINKNKNYFVPGEHLYVLVLSIINFLNNAYKFSVQNLTVGIEIFSENDDQFRISITNEMSKNARALLNTGKLDNIRAKLINMNDENLLLNNGGSGFYKCLHALKKVSGKYNLSPSFDNNTFTVEITYGY